MGVTRVREAELEGRGEGRLPHSSVPALPSLDTSRLTAGGLRRLQQHLEQLGGKEEVLA